MSTEEKYKILKSIVWDYNAEQLSLDKLISGDINSIDEYEFKFILNRNTQAKKSNTSIQKPRNTTFLT